MSRRSIAAAVTADWLAGAAAIIRMPPPGDFRDPAWRRIQTALPGFLARWAPAAAGLGWYSLDLFGAHPTRPAARLDYRGLALWLDAVEILALDGKGADVAMISDLQWKALRWRRREPDGRPALIWQCDHAGTQLKRSAGP